MRIHFFKTASGREPVRDYLDSLDNKDQAETYEVLKEIETHGFDAIGVAFRKIKDKLWEIKFKKQRFLYVSSSDKIILLHAFRKQRQKMNKREIELGIKRMNEVMQNEK